MDCILYQTLYDQNSVIISAGLCFAALIKILTLELKLKTNLHSIKLAWNGVFIENCHLIRIEVKNPRSV